MMHRRTVPALPFRFKSNKDPKTRQRAPGLGMTVLGMTALGMMVLGMMVFGDV
ncbi:MAG TPA: hypothetical protein VNN55_07840 [bacterium]|nr:hypothetical protein [bacterium]